MIAHTEPSAIYGGLPIADLEVIDFSKLLSGDNTEVARLVNVCKSLGFFYLNFNNAAGQPLLDNSCDAFKFMVKYFEQPLEVKLRDIRQSVTHGYTPTGTYTGAKRGEKDCYETLKISEAEMKARSPQLPCSVQNNVELFRNFISGSHSAVLKILECLSSGMGRTGSSRFENNHRTDVPARTTMVLFRYPRQVKEGGGLGHNMHTDIGSLTLLYCEDWGLQVLSPETNEWGFIAPRPGHAVINVGDSLRFLSGHQLASCVHRVIPVTERQEAHRYSIAYFLRPEDDAVYVDSKGRELTAREWHDGKYDVFREPHEKQEKDMILTGGMERNGNFV